MIKARQSTQSLSVSDLSKFLGPRLASAAAAGSGVGAAHHPSSEPQKIQEELSQAPVACDIMQELASEQLWDTRVKQSAGQDNLGKPVSERPEMTDHFFTTKY